VRFVVTLDTVPGAAIFFWVPGGEEIRVVEFLFELEEHLLVMWVAPLRECNWKWGQHQDA